MVTDSNSMSPVTAAGENVCPAEENRPARSWVDIKKVREWGACEGGRTWFREKFPSGGAYADVMDALRKDGRFDDARWLANRVFDVLTDTEGSVEAELTDHARMIGALIAEGDSDDDAQIGSSGDDARIGSSGYRAQIGSSGNGAQIGSSGYRAQIGSSGNGAQIGSSGDDARIGSSGNGAQIGSSGNGARIGSSGDDAQIGSSGNDAQIGS
ncbi:hypothetical protein ACRC7T_06505, partial [Segnochrobactraceae bacterium EtOH-i3]